MNRREAKEFLTESEAAQVLRVSSRTLRRWRRRGLGPKAIQPAGQGGTVLYHHDALRAWLMDFNSDVWKRAG